MKKLTCLGIIATIISIAGCLAPAVTAPRKVTVSLDWVPNTNHTGMYVALEKGWYAEEGLEVEFQIPSDPAAALKQVAAGQTELGVSFQEEVTIARAKDIPIVSVAAIIQHNTSAFAARADSGITRPREFEGKTYAAYGMALERPVLAGLMKCDGGDVDKVEFVDVGFDIFPALIGGKADLAWIFLAWDGVQAELMGEELTTFPLYGSCIPDYYTPVIGAGEQTIAKKPELIKKFMSATARGYKYATEHPTEAAEILLKHSPESDAALVKRSQEWLSPRYQDDAPRWGEQRAEVWHDFAAWMYDNGLLPQEIDANSAFTNEFLP